MSKDINQIIKSGKLTGEEVGRLMIKDMIALYEEALKDRAILEGRKEAKGILTYAQRTALVNGLNTKEDILTYNEYKGLHDYLNKVPAVFDVYQLDAEATFWRLYHLLREFKHAEEENNRLKWQPKIMTQKQYDELKKKDFEEKMTYTTSVEALILDALEYYIELYNKGEKTPFNKYFNKAKKEPLTNPRIKANYWAKGEGGYCVLPDGRSSRDMSKEEWQEEVMKHHKKIGTDEIPTIAEITFVEDLTAPEDATKWNVLEYAQGFYYSQETDSKETLGEFKADYPELYNELINKLASMKGLSFLKATPEAEYFNEDLISWKDLYNNKVLNYPDIVDSFNMDKCGGGIAVLQPHVCYPTKDIDEQGYYKTPEPYWRKHYMAEAILEGDWIEFIVKATAKLEYGIKECFVIKEAVNLLSEYIEIPEINILLGEVNLIDKVIMINDLMEILPHEIQRYGIIEGERPAEELKEELKNILKPIDLKNLKPSKEATKKAKRIIDLKLIKEGNQDRIYNILRGANE